MISVFMRPGLALLLILTVVNGWGTASARASEESKIEGQSIARAGGGWLGLKVESGTFRLRFYDANKQPVAPDVPRAVLRWKSNRRIAREVVVLTPGGGPNLMTSERTVPPPFNFRLTIVLMRASTGDTEADDAAAETIVVDFRQDPAAG